MNKRQVFTRDPEELRRLLDGQTALARARADLIVDLWGQIAALTAETLRLRRELDAERRTRRAA